MLWLIENLTKEQSYLDLAAAVQRAGLPCRQILGDFAVTDLADLQRRPTPVIFCGSIRMTQLIRGQLHATCAPLAYSTDEKYLCATYYPIFGDLLFNDRYVLLPFGDLRRQKSQLLRTFAREDTLFLRPDGGDKPFKAGLVTAPDFESFCDRCPCAPSDLVLVSTPKSISGEWRFVVDRTRRILAVSSYRRGNAVVREPGAPRACIEFCEEVLSFGYHPDSVFAVDVAQDIDGNCWLMELTSFCSAGLYACDPDAIVRGVTEIALADFHAAFPSGGEVRREREC